MFFLKEKTFVLKQAHISNLNTVLQDAILIAPRIVNAQR